MSLRLFIVMLSIAVIAMTASAQTVVPPPPRTITVAGTAERMVTPDLAIIVLAIQTQAARVSDAVEQNNRNTARVMEAIRRLNIPNLTMRTINFNVQPVYEVRTQPSTTPPRIIAYQVINQLEVRIQNTNPEQLSAQVGRVLDAALDAGANRVDSVQFTLQDEQPIQRAVLADATRNAALTAQAIAQAAGVQIAQVLTISATPYYQPPMPYLARAEVQAAGVAAVPVVVGQITVRATVNSVYEIR